MLAGAMIQSCLLAGNTGGIALAVDIEMGFTDRLLAAPISRFSIVLGRLAGTAALGAFTAVWFLAIGLIFGASFEEGVLGVLLMIVLVTSLGAVAFGGIGAAIALHTGSASVVQGLFPLVFVILFLSSAFFPDTLLLEPAATIAEYNPLCFIVEGDPRAGDRLAHARDRSGRGARRAIALVGRGLDRASALRRRLRRAADGMRTDAGPHLAEVDSRRAYVAAVAALVRRSRNELLRVPGAAIPGVLAPTIFFLGLTAVFGSLTLLAGLRHRQLPELHHPGQPAPGRRLHRRRHRRQPRPRHRAGLVRPPARLPRPAPGAARRARALGQPAGADPGDGAARRRLRARRRLARARRARAGAAAA